MKQSQIKNKMKSSAEKEEKSKLCREVSNEKFAIKYINLLVCGSYLITFVIALALTTYIHYVGEKQSQKMQINFEKFLEKELLKHKEYNNKNNIERLQG